MALRKSEFRAGLDDLQSIISRACLYHAAWESLWPVNKEIRVLINFRDFFDPVRGALFEGILYHIGRSLSIEPSDPSLPNLLKAAAEEDNMFIPHRDAKDIDSMHAQIEQDTNTLYGLNNMRKQHLVHLEALPSEDNSIRKNDVDNLVSGVKMTFSRLFYAHHWSSPRWSPRPLRTSGLTSALIDFLWAELEKRNPS